ncbi:ScbA/BarX family gamma-butyrolactone biosynthesis protein [Streptomyces bauhiniae]|uniref:ScbA/BarX family gamma-butyrolactone biosynthesis protein n=1 Tax=Streptomyces bauhiniae TaxID=2340725 RepID=UPI0034536EE4
MTDGVEPALGIVTVPRPLPLAAPDGTGRTAAHTVTVPAPAGGVATPDLCHRPDPEDLFPLRWERTGDQLFHVPVRWPAAHRLFTPGPDGCQDPMLVSETTRQATMMLAHAAYGVPVGDQFLMWGLGHRIVVPDFTVEAASGTIDVTVSCSQVELRARRLVGMRVDLDFRSRGRLLATSFGILSVTSARVYRRLRGDRPAAPGTVPPPPSALPPHQVGRRASRDVVLAPAGDHPGWRLRVDTAHPTYFARANDHVPGMVLIEAARQAACVLAPGHRFHAALMRASFQRYCELTEPCWILAEHETSGDEGAVVRVQGLQNGEPVFTVTLGEAAGERG